MAAVRGKIFVYHNPQTKQLEVIAENQGDSPGTLTHNILATEREAKGGNANTQHDDHHRYGHGDTVAAGTTAHPSVTVRRFPIGGKYGLAYGTYQNLTITPGQWIRVGFRYAAWKAVQIPEAGGIVEIPYEEMSKGNTLGRTQPFQPQPYREPGQVPAALAQVYQARGLNKKPRKMRVPPAIQGHAIVSAINGPDGKVQKWRVRFTNTGKTAFIGTAVLRAANKRAGRGLDSLPTPDKGQSAVLDIEAGADYGTRAQAGRVLRLGIRGYGYTEVSLPKEGRVFVSAKDFVLDADKSSPKYFTKKHVREKQREKAGRVKFYEGGRALSVKPLVCTGLDALDKADFEPPRLTIRRVQRRQWSDRGRTRLVRTWQINLEAGVLEDVEGMVEYVARLKINGKQLPPKLMSSESAEYWELNEDQFEDMKIKPGDEISIDTGSFGWRVKQSLPRNSGYIYEPGEDAWEFRPHLEDRWKLKAEALAAVDEIE